MSNDNKCRLWETVAEGVSPISWGADGMRHKVTGSHRAGGNYIITEQALNFLQMRADKDQIKARLSCWIVDQQRPGHAGPEITKETVEQFAQNKPMLVHERADRLLRYLEKKSPVIGSMVTCQTNSQDDSVLQEMLALSESVSASELLFLKNYLVERKWTNEPRIAMGAFSAVVTLEGYAHLAKLATKQINSSQGFVAMWFDDSMTEAYEKGIAPGIKDAGYEPLRIDKKEFLNKIDDEIIAEIRRSRFVVADFTADRGGVYYEAGFAHGMNIPLIFTCREDTLQNIHFDTRQFPHIVWRNHNDLRKQLADRISAVIGDGPNKTPKAK